MYEIPTDDSIPSVLDAFVAHGWTESHVIQPGARMRCGKCEHTSPARAAIVDALHRVEGPTDPADLQLVIGLHCPHCDAAGTVVTAYGPLADDPARSFSGAIRPDRPVDPVALPHRSGQAGRIAILRPASVDRGLPEIVPGTVAAKHPPSPLARRAHRDANGPLGRSGTVGEIAVDYCGELDRVEQAAHWWVRRVGRLPSDHHRAHRTLATLFAATREIRDRAPSFAAVGAATSAADRRSTESIATGGRTHG